MSKNDRARRLLGALGICATVVAAVLAATAVPASAKSGNGHAQNGKALAKGHAKTHGSAGAHVSAGKSSTSTGESHASTGKGDSTDAQTHVTICHATPPDTAANGYVQISPSASGVYHGHLRQHSADIIPPFTYDGVTYSENWDATGQAIWNNGCATAASTGSGVEGAAHAKGGEKAHGKGEAHVEGAAHGKGEEHGHGAANGRGNSQGNSANAHEHVTICHATPPDSAANGYVLISPSASGVYHGHLRQHSADIIPPFIYDGVTYSENWDATGQAIWNNGCATSASTTSTGSTTDTTETETTVTTTAGVKGTHHTKVRVKVEHKVVWVSTTLHLPPTKTTIFVKAAKKTFHTIVVTLGENSTTSTQTSGVLGAHKTLKRVSHRATAAKPTTSAATFTG